MNQRHLLAPSKSDSSGVLSRSVQMNEKIDDEESNINNKGSSDNRESLENVHISQKDYMKGLILCP